MATNHTQNYQLNLWEAQDTFLRTEFNENSQKIDAALKAEADARAAGDAALQTAVAAKADASTVTALTQTVNGKAEASAVTALTQTVNGKADASAVNAALAQKADVTAMNTAIAACSHVSIGIYTGNGAETRIIDLGFRPKAVFVFPQGTMPFANYNSGTTMCCGLAVDGSGTTSTTANSSTTQKCAVLTVVDSGFEVYCRSLGQTNINSTKYHYIAFL